MWMNFGIKDLIDVLLVAFFLYQTYKLMKNSGTLAIFSGVVSFIIVWYSGFPSVGDAFDGSDTRQVYQCRFPCAGDFVQDEIRRFWWRSVRTGDGSFWEKYFEEEP